MVVVVAVVVAVVLVLVASGFEHNHIIFQLRPMYGDFTARYRTDIYDLRKISYDLTRFGECMGDIVPDIVRFYERYRTIYGDCTAIVRLDIVHIPYRYSTDIVPILRYPHLNAEEARVWERGGDLA